MATKAQLKEYFKSQKIPTEAQFGTFIDSTFYYLKIKSMKQLNLVMVMKVENLI